jgi:5-methylcytosine-specific restriction endonuclease McrA
MVSPFRGRKWQELAATVKRLRPPICGPCGGPIDMTVSGRHPDGWTCDHILPYKTHPHLALVYSNLQPAHQRCNSSKGARTGVPATTSHYRAEHL